MNSGGGLALRCKKGAFSMLIQCTKKLLDELKIKPAEPPTDAERLFSWHANIMLIGRKKTLVLVNDRNRFTVVLFGLKAKHMKKIQQLMKDAIRETLQAEGIKDEFIEPFFRNDVVFSKTQGRTFVARMNKACENVYYFQEYLQEEVINQIELSKRVSRLYAGEGKGYIEPNEEMYKDIAAWNGQPIFHTEAIQLKITLQLENHRIWRRVIVPIHKTFSQLHTVIQAAFNWQDEHLHEFYILDLAGKPIAHLVATEEAFAYARDEVPMKMDKDVNLSEYLPNKMLYVYDFGDEWQHVIEVEGSMNDYSNPFPICVDGKGNTPPEDVGGEGGFEYFMEVLADKSHPEYEHMYSWGKSQGFERFDRDQVNRMLKSL